MTVQSGLCVQSAAKVLADPGQVSETQDVFSSLLASIFLLDEQIFQFQIVFAQCIVNV